MVLSEELCETPWDVKTTKGLVSLSRHKNRIIIVVVERLRCLYKERWAIFSEVNDPLDDLTNISLFF